MENQELCDWVYNVAETFDVSTPKDGLVMYSISFLKNDENKRKALDFVADYDGKLLLEQTKCGEALESLGFFDEPEKFEEQMRDEIWRIFLERGIAAASGNVTVFVDGADVQGKFVDVCVKALLANDLITTINDFDKFDFIEEKIKLKHRGVNIDEYAQKMRNRRL